MTLGSETMPLLVDGGLNWFHCPVYRSPAYTQMYSFEVNQSHTSIFHVFQ